MTTAIAPAVAGGKGWAGRAIARPLPVGVEPAMLGSLSDEKARGRSTYVSPPENIVRDHLTCTSFAF
ncbi:hypothetical protein [Paracoccus spongiarum]|uniref:Uncharacterized protein n=1 Tax=Paracoccus spongiarum TaxID=3064387 RepID=A0ABT9JFW9_9RHOB|nr:hypothetical protein [Paracoccus sp. 2205BS29-5]MDP5308736.1 hypothetical protein [Paracoccus sp. 2205BS29-5]